MPKENEFYLLDTRTYLGSTCTFWAIDGHGYVSDLTKAHVFNLKEAQKWANKKNHFTPLSKAQVDALATKRIDCQQLESDKDHSLSEGIVINSPPREFDGNDIYFLAEDGKVTANYNEARVFTPDEALKKLTQTTGKIMSKAFLDSICRPTFQKQNINKRKMMGSAGIKYRSPKKRIRSGKQRTNCPKCGKIMWVRYDGDNPCCEPANYY